jgi:hypothetical protein
MDGQRTRQVALEEERLEGFDCVHGGAVSGGGLNALAR